MTRGGAPMEAQVLANLAACVPPTSVTSAATATASTAGSTPSLLSHLPSSLLVCLRQAACAHLSAAARGSDAADLQSALHAAHLVAPAAPAAPTPTPGPNLEPAGLGPGPVAPAASALLAEGQSSGREAGEYQHHLRRASERLAVLTAVMPLPASIAPGPPPTAPPSPSPSPPAAVPPAIQTGLTPHTLLSVDIGRSVTDSPISTACPAAAAATATATASGRIVPSTELLEPWAVEGGRALIRTWLRHAFCIDVAEQQPPRRSTAGEAATVECSPLHPLDDPLCNGLVLHTVATKLGERTAWAPPRPSTAAVDPSASRSDPPAASRPPFQRPCAFAHSEANLIAAVDALRTAVGSGSVMLMSTEVGVFRRALTRVAAGERPPVWRLLYNLRQHDLAPAVPYPPSCQQAAAASRAQTAAHTGCGPPAKRGGDGGESGPRLRYATNPKP